MKICNQCKSQFEITDKDRQFYERMDAPEPKMCPDCRNKCRMTWRNEKTLYKRKCDLCHKDIISIYSSDKIFPVYCTDCFWGDKWNPLSYGVEFDFSRPFFNQFRELMLKVPRLAIVNKQSQNSDYCNYSFANKNCYLTFGNHYEEDSMYGRYSTKNKFCLDYLFTYNSELCYENVFSKNCYSSVYLEHCDGCDSCYFSRDLIGCKNCLFCANLNHKEYYILNKPYSKEEYEKQLSSSNFNNYIGFQKAREFFLGEFANRFPVRSTYQLNCENSIGDNLNNCKNIRDCFDCTNCEDIAYACQIDETYDSMDMTCMGYDKSEVCYETIGCSGIFNCISCDSCWHNSDLSYCNLCFSVKNSFGCISLQHKENCILNKQYSKEEYKVVVSRIIEHMKKSGEWGNFFTVKISPFAYNETIANEYYPMSEKEVQNNDWEWKIQKDEVLNVTKTIPASRLPDSIADIPDEILNWAIECEQTKRPFKIQKGELSFYRKLNLPIPHFHPDVRFEMRMQRKKPRKLSDAKCNKCGSVIKSSFDSVGDSQILCEKCFINKMQ